MADSRAHIVGQSDDITATAHLSLVKQIKDYSNKGMFFTGTSQR